MDTKLKRKLSSGILFIGGVKDGEREHIPWQHTQIRVPILRYKDIYPDITYQQYKLVRSQSGKEIYMVAVLDSIPEEDVIGMLIARYPGKRARRQRYVSIRHSVFCSKHRNAAAPCSGLSDCYK